MAGVNKVILVGRLGKDPELKYTGTGKAVCNFSMATGKDDKVQWHRIVAWEKLAETCGEYLKKGKQVYIEGSIRSREWEDKEGNKRETTEIHAYTMQMLGAASDRVRSDAGDNASPINDVPDVGTEDDVPF